MKFCLRPGALVIALALGLSHPLLASAQSPATAPKAPAAATPTQADGGPAPQAPSSSSMDGLLFFQLLLAELELREGSAGNAFDMLLDAARRSKDEGVFRRSVEIALQARAGDQALQAARAWRLVLPQSAEALRFQIQILTALNRAGEVAEPLSVLLAMTPATERSGAIASLPRFLQRIGDAKLVLQLLQTVLKPYVDAPATQVAAKVALARVAFAAADTPQALKLLGQAQAADAAAPGPALAALDMMAREPQAEALVQAHLASAQATLPMRLAYARALTLLQRHADAIKQFDIVTARAPDDAPPWLTLGALHVELKHPAEAETALARYIALAKAQLAARPPSAPAPTADDEDDDLVGASAANRPDRGLDQAHLLMAAVAEQRNDFKAAEDWLAQVKDPQRVLDVQTRRAVALARQGKLKEARELVRNVPAASPEQQRARFNAEAQMLREAKAWEQAHGVLAEALQRFPDDADLLYEQAMMDEKLDRLDAMEQGLKRVMQLKPNNAAAYNALGYSLADRKLRLPEARELIQRALELQPGDPFITDSLGWVEFRMGNFAEAERLLRQAYRARPDTEIAAHLGEVLWAMGQRDEAKRIWREGQARDAQNETLRETLARLRPGL